MKNKLNPTQKLVLSAIIILCLLAIDFQQSHQSGFNQLILNLRFQKSPPGSTAAPLSL